MSGEGRFSLSQGDSGGQHLQQQLDEIDARSPTPPFADADHRFLVSTLPVEPAIAVAIGIEVIARASGPGCVAALGPMPGRVNVPQAIQRVVSAHWMQQILCMRVANGMGGPEPSGEVLEAVIKGNIARTDAEQLREWYLEAHTFWRSRQERSAALDEEDLRWAIRGVVWRTAAQLETPGSPVGGGGTNKRITARQDERRIRGRFPSSQ
jgi:hypothetical protein